MQAQEPITIVTKPTGASVYLSPDGKQKGTRLGVSGEVVQLPQFEESLFLVLEMHGHFDRPILLKPLDLKAPLYPSEGQIALEPINQGFVRRHIGLIGLLSGSILIGFPTFLFREHRARKKRQVRQEQLAQYEQKASLSDPHLMTLIGGYRLVELLGEEDEFRVYLGLDDRTLRPETVVSIKILKNKVKANERSVARFRREMGLSKNLENSRIVRTFDANEANGYLYLVQEHIAGETLRDRMGKDPISIKQTIDILTEIMEGLSYAHQRGIIHRDIKPENLIIAENGIKLTNFGLARSVDSEHLTKTSTSLGTPTYTAPEQISGETSKVTDGRCDQYSVGVLAYQLLTGKPPFINPSVPKLLLAHLYDTPEPIDSSVPEQISSVVFRMLAKSPEDRFVTLDEASESLKRAFEAAQHAQTASE